MTTRKVGPWVMWTAAGRADADPYTRAHFARRGTLPISSSLAQSYEAINDSDGRRLNALCEYTIAGEEPDARWWSLGVYDDRGRLIPNTAGRYSYNSATLMRGAGNRLSITLAPGVRPGNWLPTGGSGRIVLVLNIEELRSSGASDGAGPAKLPEIRRVGCR